MRRRLRFPRVWTLVHADFPRSHSHAPADVPKALNETLKHLGVEYLDLYLMHWPVADDGSTKSIDYLDTWAAMANLPKSLVRNIGISNFSPAQITALIAAHPLSKPYATPIHFPSYSTPDTEHH